MIYNHAKLARIIRNVRNSLKKRRIDEKKDAGLKESCIFGLFWGSPLEQECHYQVADADADECGYPAGELEGVVDDILAYAGCSFTRVDVQTSNIG